MKKDFSELRHIRRVLPNGAKVIFLDNGAIIDAEAEAMIQALHSRELGGFDAHMVTLSEKGAENFMSRFYVGYGHKSIGDCGSGTLFIEGVSMLVAKAIQDSPLYSGQESSTRYIDFSKQPFMDPTNSPEGQAVLEMQRSFYLSVLDPIRGMLRRTRPIDEGESESIYQKAINARSFDIARGLLPAGASTNLSWHSNLRQISDKILFLRHHPLREVRAIAEGLEEVVREKYPSSFSGKRYPSTENYQENVASEYYYHHDLSCPNLEITDCLDARVLENLASLINSRSAKTELPQYVSLAGDVHIKFLLDFGSFRDIQRHRSLNQRMPLLTTDLGFNPWYLENLGEELLPVVKEHLERTEAAIGKLGVSPLEQQYFIPMGYNVSNDVRGDLPSVVYVAELRSGSTVHPTLRIVAQNIGRYLEGRGITMHLALHPDNFELKRGTQDILSI